MAEHVERKLEDMLPELEQLERTGLFTSKQIRKIVMKRKTFEYKLKRITKVKEDYINYIQYEINLLALIRKRRQDLQMTKLYMAEMMEYVFERVKNSMGKTEEENELRYFFKRVEIDFKIEARINQLFRMAHLRFSEDVKLWLSHIAFCKQRKQIKTVSKLFTTMLKMHNKKQDLWIYAAKWEFEDNANPDTARNLLQRGLRFNKESKKLWLEYFRFELLYAEKMRKRQEVVMETLEAEQKVDDKVLKGDVAVVVYNQAKLAVPDDVAFIVSFLPVCQQFDFAMDIEDRIFIDLEDQYPNSSLTWDALARRRLGRKEGIFKDGKNPEKEFHAVYEVGVQAAPSDETWSLYLTGCFQLISQAKKDKLKEKRQQRVLLVLEEAKSAGHLTAPFWNKWIELLTSMDMADKALLVATEATTAHPGETDLWSKRLNLQISQNADLNKLQELLKIAKQHVPRKDIWPMVRDILEYSISVLDRDTTVNMLETCLNDRFDLSGPAKEIYLDFEYLNSGIEQARKVYTRISQSPPVPLSFFKKYINIEKCQIRQKMALIRRAFEDATLQHGKTSPDIWLDYIKAETNYGSPEKVGSINLRALKALEGSHSQEFVTQLTLMQNTGRI